MSVLVEKLSDGDHPVEVSIRPNRTPTGLRECLDKGYVYLKFTDTIGGTDLYVPLEPGASDWVSADFERGTGHMKLVGRLTLDYVPVRCVADIDLETMTGKGHLQPID